MPATTKVLIDYDDTSLDPLEGSILLLTLPSGHRRVWRGATKPGDLYLCFNSLREGHVVWIPVDKRLHRVSSFACIIRPDGEKEVDEPCKRCACMRCQPGCVHCRDCVRVIAEQVK